MPAPAPLTEAETKSLLGVYIFGSGPTQRVEISWDPKMYGIKSYTYAPQLSWTREGTWEPSAVSSRRAHILSSGSAIRQNSLR